MSAELKHIPFDEFIRDAPALFDDMERDGQPVVVERAGKSFTLRPSRARRRKKTGIILPDDPLWDMVGAFSSGEPNNDVARNKHKYLADAYAAHGVDRNPQTTQGERGAPSDGDDATSANPS